MSRHLMAKMRGRRRLASDFQYPWQQNNPLAWSEYVSDNPSELSPSGYPKHHADDHSSAIVHHGEQQFGLEVMPNSYDNKNPWTWGIHQHKNKRSLVWDDPDIPEEYKGEWLNWISSGEWDHPEGTPAQYFGQAATREEAMQAAEENWEKHKAHVNSQNPMYGDINDFMRRFNNGEL